MGWDLRPQASKAPFKDRANGDRPPDGSVLFRTSSHSGGLKVEHDVKQPGGVENSASAGQKDAQGPCRPSFGSFASLGGATIGLHDCKLTSTTSKPGLYAAEIEMDHAPALEHGLESRDFLLPVE